MRYESRSAALDVGFRDKLNTACTWCAICKRILNNPDDPLSVDCGGDCWGCIGEIEADLRHEPSLTQVRKEFDLGFRPNWIDPLIPR